MSLPNELPSEDEVLEMEPEELAPFVLRYLQKQDPRTINRYNFSLVRSSNFAPSSEKYAQCLMEAWIYLEREGFIAPQPGQQGDWSFVTRKGQRVAEMQDFNTYR